MLIKKIRTKLILSLFLSIGFLISCSDDDPVVENPKEDITVVASKADNLTSLVAALQKADLVSALQADGPFTVFAPTNEAFQKLLDANNMWNSLDDIPVETLKAVLLYHVVSTKALSTDLSDDQELTTLNGAKITVDLSAGVKLETESNQSVSVNTVDVDASNGVIHLVDEVLLPNALFMDIVGIASGNNDFSILVEALQKTDLVSALQAEGPLTVFAPTNEAFQKLLDTKAAWSSLDDVPVEILKDVLLYHVVSAKAFSSDLSNGQELETLNTEKLIVDLSSGVKLTTAAGQSVAVTNADLQASNGVIHVIDEVLLTDVLPKDITDLAIETPELSTLVAALQKADLVGALQADGPFTVFAPTNEAFQALLDSNASWSSLDDIPVETLKSVLLFHVLSGEVKSTDLSDTYVNTLATGSNDEPLSLQVEVTGAIEFNGDAKPVTVDVQGSNGVVHIIDKVMLPPNVVTLALNNAGFTSLVAALTDSRHTTNFVETLSGNGPFTIFAPTNDAFQALLDSNMMWNSIGDIPIATLDAVLKYHVVNGSNVQADQLTNGDVTTLGGTVTIDLTSGAQIKTSSMQTVNILVGAATNDVQGTNGVIHAVDTVLLP